MTHPSTTAPIDLANLAAAHAELQPELGQAIAAILGSSHFILGPEVAAFESEFAAACGVEHAIGVGNGTDALELALWAVGVGPGDEVITVANTFTATAEAIVRCGAVPRFVDVDPDTLLIDVAATEKAITPLTRAIVPVHLFGSCADMPRLMRLAWQHRLRVVEDCAQAHLATIAQGHAGSFGDAGTFSFYPGKNLGACGDAGAVVTRDGEVADRIRRARDHGRMSKYEHEFVGRNSRMDAIQAAVLRIKLRHLAGWTQRRREIADFFRQAFAASDCISVVQEPDGVAAVYHLFVVQVDNRDQVRKTLARQQVLTGVHYPVPLHHQLAFRGIVDPSLQLPVTELAARRIVSLPLHPQMSDDEVRRVVDATLAASVGRSAAA
jgi:dTDP-4-amino-4,6-dideoxygalactose transaminase